MTPDAVRWLGVLACSCIVDITENFMSVTVFGLRDGMTPYNNVVDRY